MSDIVSLKRDEYLFKETSPLEYIYLIENGEVGLIKSNGDNNIEFMQQKEGDIVGIDIMFSGGGCEYSAITKKESSFYKTPINEFKRILNHQKSTSLELAKYLCSLLDKMENKNAYSSI